MYDLINERKKKKKMFLQIKHICYFIDCCNKTIIKIENIIFVYIFIIFTFSVSAELMSMPCQLTNNVSTIIIISNSRRLYIFNIVISTITIITCCTVGLVNHY